MNSPQTASAHSPKTGFVLALATVLGLAFGRPAQAEPIQVTQIFGTGQFDLVSTTIGVAPVSIFPPGISDLVPPGVVFRFNSSPGISVNLPVRFNQTIQLNNTLTIPGPSDPDQNPYFRVLNAGTIFPLDKAIFGLPDGPEVFGLRFRSRADVINPDQLVVTADEFLFGPDVNGNFDFSPFRASPNTMQTELPFLTATLTASGLENVITNGGSITGGSFDFVQQGVSVPEPGTFALLALGFICILAKRTPLALR